MQHINMFKNLFKDDIWVEGNEVMKEFVRTYAEKPKSDPEEKITDEGVVNILSEMDHQAGETEKEKIDKRPTKKRKPESGKENGKPKTKRKKNRKPNTNTPAPPETTKTETPGEADGENEDTASEGDILQDKTVQPPAQKKNKQKKNNRIRRLSSSSLQEVSKTLSKERKLCIQYWNDADGVRETLDKEVDEAAGYAPSDITSRLDFSGTNISTRLKPPLIPYRNHVYEYLKRKFTPGETRHIVIRRFAHLDKKEQATEQQLKNLTKNVNKLVFLNRSIRKLFRKGTQEDEDSEDTMLDIYDKKTSETVKTVEPESTSPEVEPSAVPKPNGTDQTTLTDAPLEIDAKATPASSSPIAPPAV